MTGETKELRLRYPAEDMADLIRILRTVDLLPLPACLAVLITVASDITNWHPVEEA